MPDFLQLPDVLQLHEDQIRRYGGSLGVRDMGLLESAIAQPQAGFDGQYLHDEPFGMAAAFLFHIVQNHPFIDWNKRAGAVAALLFLELNGLTIDAPQGSLYELTIRVATSQSSKAEIAAFFESHHV